MHTHEAPSHADNDQRRYSLLQTLCSLALCGVFGLTVLGMIGWFDSIPALTELHLHTKPFGPISILQLFVFAGLVWVMPRIQRRTARVWFLVMTALLMLYSLSDVLLMSRSPTQTIEHAVFALLHFAHQEIIHSSPPADFLAFLCGLALLLAAFRRESLRHLAGWLTLGIQLIAFTFLLGYLYGSPLLYGSQVIPISLPASLGFFLLGMALTSRLGFHTQPLCWFADGSTRARLLTVFVPFIFVMLALTHFVIRLTLTLLAEYTAILAAVMSILFSLVAVAVVSFLSRQIGRALDEANVEIRRSATALRAESGRLLVTLNSIGDGVIVTDAQGCVVLLNPIAETLTGWTQDAATGQPITTIFHIVNEESRQPVENPVAKVMETGGIVGLANHTALIARDGTERSIADSGAPIRAADGTIIGVVLVFRDVTDERRAERGLRESEERFRQLFTAMSEGFALHEIICDDAGMPVDYRFLAINPAFETQTGLVSEQIVGRTIREVIPTLDQAWIDRYGQVALSGRAIQFIQHADPLERVYEVMAYSPRPGQFATIFMDITEKHRDQERLLVTLNSIGDGVIVTDAQGCVVLLNPIAETLTGWTQDAATGQPITAIFHIVNEESRQPVENPVAKVMETGGIVGLANHTALIARDGFERSIADSGAPIRDADGTIIGVVLVFRDVTDERRAERGLRESEERFRLFYTNAPIAYQSLDADGNFLEVNDAWLALLGYTREEVLGCWYGDFLTPDYQELFTERFPLFLENGTTTGIDFDLRHRDGHVVSTSINGRVEYADDGTPLRTHCVLHDVTLRKQAEEQTRRYAQRLDRLVRIAQSSADSIQELLDYALAEAIQLTDSTIGYIFHYSEADASFTLYDWSASARGDCHIASPPMVYHLPDTGVWGEAVRQRRPIIINDFTESSPLCKGVPHGHVPLHKFLTVPIFSDGAIVGVVGVANKATDYDDIDVQQLTLLMDSVWKLVERKRIENQHTVILQTALQGLMIFDADTGQFQEVNEAACSMLGYTADEFTRLTVMDIEANESPELVHAHIAEVIANKFVRFESQHRRKDGTIIPVDLSIRYLPDAHHCVVFARDMTAQKRAEQALIRSRDYYLTLFEHFPAMIWRADTSGSCNYFNQTWLTFTGRALDDELGEGWADNVHPDDRDGCVAEYLRAFQARETFEIRYRLRRYDGAYRWIHDFGRPFQGLDGAFAGYIGVCTDITDHLQAEEQLRQAAKMESIGRLAGGVAHDFNNILTGLIGLTQLAQASLPKTDRAYSDLSEVLGLADRAANLTRQLLAFSRQQPLEPQHLDINAVIDNLLKMLKRLIGEDIHLEFISTPHLGTIYADPGQVEQILLNLAVNARDAMPEGGSLVIETDSVVLDQQYADAHVGVKPGAYIVMSVTDTGIGMTPEVREHIFEPFYTTKGQGHGTGLGLATVYGIIKQHNGNIWVYSEPGKGSTFKIYLPQHDITQGEPQTDNQAPALLAGDATVLLVEDEPSVRAVTRRMLEAGGYHVIEAASPADALALYDAHDASISLLVTDIVMPAQNGFDLYQVLIQRNSSLRALFMSGYSGAVLPQLQALPLGCAFIQKPFSQRALLHRVQELVEGVTSGGNRHGS